jgi:cytochrome c biogenesis protein CcmG, thiol:disulfide interchange protein DsbE
VNRWLDRILLGSVAVLAAALIFVVSETLQDRVINAGETAPNFSVRTDDGKTITRDNFGGKLLVLNFWATFCAPCIQEMPTLDAFQRQFAKQGVVVLGVSVDRNEKLYRRFVDRAQLAFETSIDPEANISASYGTFQFPETYIIDRSGKVVEKFIGAENWMDPEFLTRVRRLL